MKIALLIDSLAAGGAERQLILLANGLAARNYDVHLIIYNDQRQLIDDVDRSSVRIISVPKKSRVDALFFFLLISTLRDIKPNVIISFLTGPNFWARVCGPFAKPNGIITSERNIDLVQSKLRVLIERILYPLSAKIVVNTYACKKLMEEFCRIPPEKLAVIYNGVDLQRFRPEIDADFAETRRTFNLCQDDFVIALPGRLELQKNHYCLIRAVSHLTSYCDKIKVLFIAYENDLALNQILLESQVVFIGNENDLALKQYLIERIDERGLKQNFRFCGVVQDMVGLYNMANLIVLPSKWEGLPNVVLEAMACEKLVIVSDVADNRDIVEDGISGYLFKNDDDLELARKISYVIDNRQDARRSIGAAARLRIDENYSVRAYLANFEKLIRNIGQC